MFHDDAATDVDQVDLVSPGQQMNTMGSRRVPVGRRVRTGGGCILSGSLCILSIGIQGEGQDQQDGESLF
ncbi:MAG: hypothetical protein P4L51_17655 [Puia sp.]|nr:hypothetical protein [Puia sp.]